MHDKPRWLGLVALMPMIAMVFADQGILAVALPTMQIYFGATEEQLLWCINSYLLVSALLLLPSGRFGERVGYRKAFIQGMVIFGIASLLCVLSPNVWWLIGSRGLQGAGMALAIPASYPLIMSLFPANQRGKAVGINTSISSLFWIISPLIGGYCVQKASWQWIFWINIPLVLVGLALVLRFIPRSPTGDANAAYPLIDFSMFRFPTYRAVNISIFIVQFILISAIYRAIFFQDTLGWSPLKSGVVLLVSSAPVLIFPPISGWLADRFGSKLPISIGYIFLSLSLFWIAFFVRSPLEIFFLGLFVMSIGVSMIITPSYAAVMGIAPQNRAGTAFAMVATLRALAATLGVIVTSSFVTYEQMQSLRTLLEEGHSSREVLYSDISLSSAQFKAFFLVHGALGVSALIAFVLVMRIMRKTEEPKGTV